MYVCVRACILFATCLSLSFDSLVLAFRHDICSIKRLMKAKETNKKKNLFVPLRTLDNYGYSCDKKLFIRCRLEEFEEEQYFESCSFFFFFFFFFSSYQLFITLSQYAKKRRREKEIITTFNQD